jgi:hypothetical protein
MAGVRRISCFHRLERATSGSRIIPRCLPSVTDAMNHGARPLPCLSRSELHTAQLVCALGNTRQFKRGMFAEEKGCAGSIAGRCPTREFADTSAPFLRNQDLLKSNKSFKKCSDQGVKRCVLVTRVTYNSEKSQNLVTMSMTPSCYPSPFLRSFMRSSPQIHRRGRS